MLQRLFPVIADIYTYIIAFYLLALIQLVDRVVNLFMPLVSGSGAPVACWEDTL